MRTEVNPSDMSILYVEDDAIVREILCSFLTAKYPFVPIYSAGSAEEGLELFTKHLPSVVMTDINLVESNGIQMVRLIKKLEPSTAVVFITGCAEVERLAEFKDDSSCHYICKPLNYNDLFALLNHYIASVKKEAGINRL